MQKMSDVYPDLLRVLRDDSHDVVVRGKKIKEINLALFELDPLYPFYDSSIRSFPWKYMYGELLWYLSKDNNIDFIKHFSKFWKRLAKEDNTVQSAYGYLIFTRFNGQFSAFEFALNNLKNDKYTRQAIIRYNRPEHEFYLVDFVCTMFQQFFIRNNKLFSYVVMRSSDVIRGITFDIPWFSFVHQLLYDELRKVYSDLKLGSLTYFGGSVHIYEEHFNILEGLDDAEWEHDFPEWRITNKFIDIATMEPTSLVTDLKGQAMSVKDYKTAVFDLCK